MSDALTLATDFIAEHEGFSASPYQDSGGVWTNGYGFTYNEDGSKVTEDDPDLAEPSARVRLSSLVASVMKSVQALLTISPSNHQLAALTSFAYNCGTDALRHSTLLRKFNSGDTAGASQQFGLWVHAAGEVIQGLVNRRKAEMDLFLTSDTEN